MQLTSLQLGGVRNLFTSKLRFHPAINLIFGPNGSGKTSILEAINLLSLGRSFRTHELQSVINHNENALVCYGEVSLGAKVFSLGVEKKKNSSLLCQHKGQTGIPLSNFMGNLALQSITPDSFNLLSAGPEVRRKFIDLGVFHVEHQFVDISMRYKKLLKHRNAALKQPNAASLLPPWDNQIISVAEELHNKRYSYLQGFIPVFQEVADILLPEISIHHQYYSGWKKGQSFYDALHGAKERDLKFKVTTVGPHRADIKLTSLGFSAHQVLSRGQQKLLVCALILAQSLYLFKQKRTKSVFIIDDLASELDRDNLKIILDWLFDLGHQVFLTSVDRAIWTSLYPDLSCQMFHVEQGEIIEEACEKTELTPH
tara:strand:+ start:13425 stop:14534 length:1110 start_codon:yes stop_codon:yes gene_type:complete